MTWLITQRAREQDDRSLNRTLAHSSADWLSPICGVSVAQDAFPSECSPAHAVIDSRSHNPCLVEVAIVAHSTDSPLICSCSLNSPEVARYWRWD